MDAPGIPIGIMENSVFEEYNLQLKPGDRFYIYSDGIAEAESVQSEQFGTVRLMETLQEGMNCSLGSSIELMLSKVDEWCGHRSVGDDVSVLAMEMKDH